MKYWIHRWPMCCVFLNNRSAKTNNHDRFFPLAWYLFPTKASERLVLCHHHIDMVFVHKIYWVYFIFKGLLVCFTNFSQSSVSLLMAMSVKCCLYWKVQTPLAVKSRHHSLSVGDPVLIRPAKVRIVFCPFFWNHANELQPIALLSSPTHPYLLLFILFLPDFWHSTRISGR